MVGEIIGYFTIFLGIVWFLMRSYRWNKHDDIRYRMEHPTTEDSHRMYLEKQQREKELLEKRKSFENKEDIIEELNRNSHLN